MRKKRAKKTKVTKEVEKVLGETLTPTKEEVGKYFLGFKRIEGSYNQCFEW